MPLIAQNLCLSHLLHQSQYSQMGRLEQFHYYHQHNHLRRMFENFL
jgi:hypothetical protein